MSHKGLLQFRMSEFSGAASSGAVILEEPEGPGGAAGHGEDQEQEQGPLRCGGCTLWPRQQTWLCVVPLLIGFIGLGLSLMLLKWIVVGTVRDYVPTDLVDANRIGQDPIFLSKPSGIPKIPDTTTTTTAVTMNGGNPSPRTVTVAKGKPRSTTTTPTNPRGGGGASGSQVTIRNRHPVITTSTSASRSTIGPVTSSPSPSNPTVLHDSTQMWTQEHTTTERVSTTLTTRSTGPRKTPSPTVSIPDEHFETCHEKDLAYCLNDGECFVIETSTGPHKHCKCREGYQGIRCDQFLPKTDSDPMDHLGIEFMESKEVYKRQVLSITSIAMAISLLGTLCMALYCRNKRRREKLQAHLKETRSLKNYASNGLDPKARSSNTSLQLHKYCKRPSQPREGALCESSFAHCNVNNTTTNTCRGPAKHYRSSSLSNSPDQRTRPAHWSAPRRTPPVTRGRLNPIGPSKFSGPAYQHLQEVESCEKDIEAQGYQMQGQRPSGSDPRQDAFLHMRPAVQSAEGSPLVARWGSPGPVEELTTEQKQQAPSVLRTSLRRPGHSYSSCCAPPPPFRSCSIPIIPSVHCHHHHNDISCMQTSVSPAAAESTSCKEVRRAERSERRGSSSSSCLQKRDEVATLLEEAQEQLRALALAHRKREDAAAAVNQGGSGAGAVATRVEARETVCFLSPHGGGGGGGGEGGASSGLVTETQLLSPNLSQRDLSQRGQ